MIASPKKYEGIALDSRKVKPGDLFAALPGSKVDGRDFISAAVKAGATHVLAPKGTNLPEDLDQEGVTLILSDDPRKELARLAAEFYSAQPGFIAAVTGTNGKTSVAHFAQQLWNAAGNRAVSMGTLGICGAGLDQSGALTTPDPVSLHETLADLTGKGVSHTALEASSHGLDQYRLDGVRIKAAGFTNLSRDHLDYHETMDAYLQAKTRLFTELLPESGVAVLNADIPEFEQLKKLNEEKGHKILSYGEEGSDLKIVKTQPTPHGQNVALEILGQPYEAKLSLPGDFQVHNILCALGLVLAEDQNAETVQKLMAHLKDLKGVKGRLESVPGHPHNAGVYVDYAHTPDALEHVLKALRPHTSGKLVCIMGCGGDRDKGKRPEMARAAGENADQVIITDDNPRSEDPAAIRKDALVGCPDALEIGDRAQAIAKGIQELGEGDILLIAGKGHEQGQIIGDQILPFDDVQKAQEIIEEMKK